MDSPKSCLSFYLWWHWISAPTRRSVLSCLKEKHVVIVKKNGTFRTRLQNKIWRITKSSEISHTMVNYKIWWSLLQASQFCNTVDAPDSSAHETSVSFSDSDDQEFVFTVEGTTTTSPRKQPMAKIAIECVPVRFFVDSAHWWTCYYRDPSAKEAILQKKDIPLAPTKTRIHAFGAQIPLR